MKSQEQKLRQHQLKKQFKQQETSAFISGLPMSTEKFLDLFNFLDEKLQTEACDHSLKFTEQYLRVHGLPVSNVILWLNENGGYCDCEVLSNVVERFGNL